MLLGLSLVTIRLQVSLAASAERLWSACSEPQGLSQWQADEVSGRAVVGQTLELRWPQLGATVNLDVVEARPPSRLVLASGAARLELDIRDGELELCHHGSHAGDEAEGTASAWRVSLALLAHYLAHHADRTRRVYWISRRARASVNAAHAFFTDATALRAWLTSSGDAISRTGDPYRWTLAWNEPMSGRVLSHTPGRDIALSWREQDESVLVLRTLPAPLSDSERLLAIGLSHWSPTPLHERTLAGLGAALDHLARLLSQAGSA
jgi:uncharacterized protein YndB with AHSA1/START domain